jgi:predicted amidophosphoribosyltransferase
VLDAWLDLVHGGGCVGCAAPGRSLCPRCAEGLPTSARSVRPTPCPPGLAACFAAGEYADLLRAMVLAHKEHGVFALARPLGRALAVATAAALTSGPTLLVPVPSRRAVVRARGHDPMLRIARAASGSLRRSGVPVQVVRLLAVTGPVLDQAGLDARQRAANLAGSMAVRPRARQVIAARGVPVSVVVCDDVLTTGATAREAQRALEEGGLRVRAVVTVAATRRRLPVGDAPPAPALPVSRTAD